MPVGANIVRPQNCAVTTALHGGLRAGRPTPDLPITCRAGCPHPAGNLAVTTQPPGSSRTPTPTVGADSISARRSGGCSSIPTDEHCSPLHFRTIYPRSTRFCTHRCGSFAPRRGQMPGCGRPEYQPRISLRPQ